MIKEFKKKITTFTSGFTLIELLVAATIIGVLTVIAVISYSTALKRSRDTKRKADLEAVRGALEMYRADQDSYPAALTWSGSLTGIVGGSTVTYIQQLPQDPKNPVYNYYYLQTASGYELGAYLENSGGFSFGDCGTPDIVCNYKVIQP